MAGPDARPDPGAEANPDPNGGPPPAAATTAARPSPAGLSLRWRLGLGAAIGIAAVLVLSWLGLTVLFDRQVTRLALQDLEARSVTLIDGFGPRDTAIPPADTIGGDPRYLVPFSGLYWQIDLDGQIYRSQSLWDTLLPVAATPPSRGSMLTYEGVGPDDQRLLILDRGLTIGPQARPLRISVAVSRSALEEARHFFQRDLAPVLLALGALLVAGGVAQLAIGLRPFTGVRRQIEAMNRGERPRLGQDMPQEVRPLAAAIDGLLDDRDTRIARARSRAMDLAHTLKTPLQALLAETGALRRRGEGEAADRIEEIADTIRARVEHELGRSRIAGGGEAQLREVAEGLARVLRLTPRAEQVALRVEIAPGLAARIDAHDLTEALGSVAENAMRHARSTVRIHAVRIHAGGQGPRVDLPRVDLMVEDDGEGVPEAKLAEVLRRGARLDETSEGTGVGLALAREIVEAAEGDLLLENRPGGFRVTFRLRTV